MKLHVIALTVVAALGAMAALPAAKVSQSRIVSQMNSSKQQAAETVLPDLVVIAEGSGNRKGTCALSDAGKFGDLPDVVVVAERTAASFQPVEHAIRGGNLPDIVVTAERTTDTIHVAGTPGQVTGF